MFAQSEILTFSLMDVICLPSAPTLCVIRGRGDGVLVGWTYARHDAIAAAA